MGRRLVSRCVRISAVSVSQRIANLVQMLERSERAAIQQVGFHIEEWPLDFALGK
jgi:hypothetical protein